jgi:DNA mismatch endonuclease, patch repair protein
MIVRKLVHSLGYRYRLHDRSLPGRPDMVFAKTKKIIFVHGCFWHRHHCALGDRVPKSRLDFWIPKLEENQRRDARNQHTLRELGWDILVVWECQTTESQRNRLIHDITEFLGHRALR